MKAPAPKVWTFEGRSRAPWRSPVAVVEQSGDRKLGAGCSATHASQHTCPGAKPGDKHPCSLYQTDCYAEWMGCQPFTTFRLNSNTTTDRLKIARIEAAAIDRLTGRRPLRVHVVGDCATKGSAAIVGAAMVRHTAKHGRLAWTYTHSYKTIRVSAWRGARVLASIHTAGDLRAARRHGYTAAALVVDRHPSPKLYTDPKTGLRVLPCPQQFEGSPVTCTDCRICGDPRPLATTGAVVGFQNDRLSKG